MADKIIEAALTDSIVREQNHKTTTINGDWHSALKGPIREIAKKLRKS
jgi:hypothetical protein